MKSLIFAFNSVSPIILTVAVGYLLKKAGLMDADFSKKANKLVFRIFLPVLLFTNVYGITSISTVNLGYVIYSFVALLIIFGLAIPTVILVTDKKKCRGAPLQGVFRSNYALIGIPLATSLFPGEGAAVATLLSAFMIPVFNILAVVGLSIFNNDGEKPNIKKVLLGIVKNPLIWIPATLASAITGPISTCLFKLECTGVSAGMGTCGLVGPIGVFSAMGFNATSIIGVILVCVILPAVLSLVFSEIMRKIGWIKENDMKLDL